MKRKKRLTMRKIKEILRLHYECQLSYKKIGSSLNVSPSRCFDYVQLFKKEGLSWPLSEETSDKQLEKILHKKKSKKCLDKVLPDLNMLQIEMKKKGMTLFLLWQEYRTLNPNGYGYTQFCNYYKSHIKNQDYCLRQTHKGGEKLFVDYAGQTIPIHNPKTGQIKYAQIFVCCLGASQYTYAEATWTQKSKDWISSHINAFEYFKGVPKCIVPDNLRSGVSKSCIYDPDINPTYQEMAKHYEVAVMPARVGKPKDKSKVESSVYIVERWILAAIRHYKFFSLHEANEAIKTLLNKLNRRGFKKFPGNRLDLYEEVDLPNLKSLPEKRFELCEWIPQRTVHIDYHVEIEGHYYSVPFQHIGQKVDVRMTQTGIEIYLKSKRIASHLKSIKKGHHTTQESHRPKKHQEYLKWTPTRIINWALKIGDSCSKYISEIIKSRAYPEQGFRTSLGILRLAKTYSEEELNHACKYGLVLRSYSYTTIKNILKNKSYKKLSEQKYLNPFNKTTHENIRGVNYFNCKEEENVIRANI